jgi:hypothetical protein
MEKTSIIFTLFLALFFTNINLAQETFLRIYPQLETADVYSVVETTDNHLILCGRINVSSSIQKGLLMKINQFGDIVHENQSENADLYADIELEGNNDDTFYIVGHKDSLNYNSIVVSKMNYNFDVLQSWTIGLTNTGSNYPQDFIIANDSLVIIASNFWNNHNSSQITPRLFRLNLNNSEITYLEYPITFIRYVSNIIDLKYANQFKISLFLFTSVPTSIATYDYDLNPISDYEIAGDFHSYNRVSFFNDSSYLFSASKYHNNKRELGIAQYNLSDSLLNTTIFPGSTDSMTYPAITNNILVTSDYVWVVGWYNVIPQYVPCFPESTWVVLNKLNHNLELQEQLFYGGDAVYNPSNIIETTDHNIIVIGSYYNPYLIPYECQFDPFVLKVNSEGLIVNTQNHELPLVNEAIVVPNPGKEFLAVKLAIQHHAAVLQLFDIGGRLLFTEQINTDMQQVNTSTLPAGVYPYRITAGNRIIGWGKWVKE